MFALQEQEEERLSVNPAASKARWLPRLEEELRDRIGWADEAISPFARTGRATNANADLPRAA